MLSSNVNPFLICLFGCTLLLFTCHPVDQNRKKIAQSREFNGVYTGDYLSRIAFPMGGLGAGMVCLEGTGAISHVSVRNAPDIDQEPLMFAALCIRDEYGNKARVLEGPLPERKYFGQPGSGNGLGGTSYGLPRFDECTFLSRFPFGVVNLSDPTMAFDVEITGWSPFIPGDEDNSSLPVAGVEYKFVNRSREAKEAVFSYNSTNFMRMEVPSEFGGRYGQGGSIKAIDRGFILHQNAMENHPETRGSFAIHTDDDQTKVNHHWFRGGWFDPLTVAWKDIQDANLKDNPPVNEDVAGASLYVPFKLEPGGEKTVRLMFNWFVPQSNLQRGRGPLDTTSGDAACCDTSAFYAPWYAGKFFDINDLSDYWMEFYGTLRERSVAFSDAFFDSSLPDAVLEAVSANLTILKSPTILRQIDGRMWAWEGCHDNSGCCPGSCTHVWNYAQAVPHLFPNLERTLRETEFNVSQDEEGHQTFRSALPIRSVFHNFHAAADGQLGGVMKVYREWRISGDTEWMKMMYPKAKQSLDYCIETWDPKHKGTLEEPHHNTYDIEFWGPDGMCTSFYLGALKAMVEMSIQMGEEMDLYIDLLEKGKAAMETELYNGEYFNQIIKTEGLVSASPLEIAKVSFNLNYSQEALDLLEKEGPKYQYGNGCLSDGVLGFWLARACGITENIVNPDMINSSLASIHKYNLKLSLLDHVNPQRPSYALGNDGGLLLCTWPKGGELTLPFVYSNEVWTGIEYQVASHLMMTGQVAAGTEIVEVCRKRYDGRIRNPFNEYECGHWYARALASYGLIQGLTGVRYDAVDRTLYIDSRVGNTFQSFLSTASGYGNVGLEKGKPFLILKEGEVEIERCVVSSEEMELDFRSSN